jgi:hypothetical protein
MLPGQVASTGRICWISGPDLPIIPRPQTLMITRANHGLFPGWRTVTPRPTEHDRIGTIEPWERCLGVDQTVEFSERETL